MVGLLQQLSLAVELQRVAADPGGAAGATLGLRVAVTLSKPAGAATGRCEAAHLTVLVHGIHYPVDFGVPANGLIQQFGLILILIISTIMGMN